MKGEYRWQDDPPGRSTDFFVRRLETSEKLVVTVLSEWFRGCFIHWDSRGRRTIPCSLPVEECEGHKLHLPVKWRAWLFEWNHTRREKEFLELTDWCAQGIIAQIAKGEKLRGYRLELSRGKGKTSKVKPIVLPRLDNLERLPAEIHPLETLTRLWKLNAPPRLADWQEPDDPYAGVAG